LLKFLLEASKQKKITKETRNYPKNRKRRVEYDTPEERLAAKKLQNRLGIEKWRLNKINKQKEKEYTKVYRQNENYKEKMRDYYLKWYQSPGNKEKVRVANQKYGKKGSQSTFESYRTPEYTELSQNNEDGSSTTVDNKELLQLGTFDHGNPEEMVDVDPMGNGCHNSFWESLSMDP
jgi:sulfur relay (sulfurtransferase) DsrC/TusE family protein